MSIAPDPFSVVLSYTELAYLLTLLDAEPMLGVDRNPFDGLAAEEIVIAQATARDALRARDLLRLDLDDRPLVDDDLLRILESYVSPQMVVTAFRFVVGEELPLAWFGYRRADATVTHTRPGDPLHAFALAPDMTALARAMVEFCTGNGHPMAARVPLTISGSTLAAARAAAGEGQAAEVVQVLHATGLDNDAAASLAEDLCSPLAVTAIALVAAAGDAPARRRDAIYWQSSESTARLMVYAENDAVQISSGSEADLLAILDEMM